jgi:hypothetical protein
MLPAPYWREDELPAILREFALDRGPYLELVLTMAADEIDRLRQKLIDKENGS